MVEGARLESVYTRKGIAGSNPALSASWFIKPLLSKGFVVFLGAEGAKRGVNSINLGPTQYL